MTTHTPIAVGEKTAAKMLDLDSSTFRELVARGVLPKPVRLGEFERWRVSQLEAVFSGDAALPDQDIEA